MMQTDIVVYDFDFFFILYWFQADEQWRMRENGKKLPFTNKSNRNILNTIKYKHDFFSPVFI